MFSFFFLNVSVLLLFCPTHLCQWRGDYYTHTPKYWNICYVCLSLCSSIYLRICCACVGAYHAGWILQYRSPHPPLPAGHAKGHSHLSQQPCFVGARVCTNIVQSRVKGISWKAAEVKESSFFFFFFFYLERKEIQLSEEHSATHTKEAHRDTQAHNLNSWSVNALLLLLVRAGRLVSSMWRMDGRAKKSEAVDCKGEKKCFSQLEPKEGIGDREWR